MPKHVLKWRKCSVLLFSLILMTSLFLPSLAPGASVTLSSVTAGGPAVANKIKRVIRGAAHPSLRNPLNNNHFYLATFPLPSVNPAKCVVEVRGGVFHYYDNSGTSDYWYYAYLVTYLNPNELEVQTGTIPAYTSLYHHEITEPVSYQIIEYE